jgi:hypothetical protein
MHTSDYVKPTSNSQPSGIVSIVLILESLDARRFGASKPIPRNLPEPPNVNWPPWHVPIRGLPTLALYTTQYVSQFFTLVCRNFFVAPFISGSTTNTRRAKILPVSRVFFLRRSG